MHVAPHNVVHCCPLLPITALICHDLLYHRLPHTATDWPKWFPRALLCDAKQRHEKSNLSSRQNFTHKTFWINRFCDKKVPKVRKYLRQHKCAKSAYIAFLYTWHTWRETFQTVQKHSRLSRNFPD